MPIYPLKHKETGETKELTMSLSEYEKLKDENPDWDRDYSKQGRVAVRYQPKFLRGLHGNPESWGSEPRIQTKNVFGDQG